MSVTTPQPAKKTNRIGLEHTIYRGGKTTLCAGCGHNAISERIIEDNGGYGLTKGQFSPTADIGSKLKTGVVNDLTPIDTCALAIELGASFVARSFSGDKKQLLSILKASLSHRGTALVDVISPC